MRLVALVALTACGSSSPPPAVEPAAAPVVAPSPGPTPSPPPAATSAPARATAKLDYSCFTYGNRDNRHSACSRTRDCDTYREQARGTGVVDVSGCATVETIYCFQVGGDEVCQPTLETCAAERKLLVKKGTSVQSDCAKPF